MVIEMRRLNFAAVLFIFVVSVIGSSMLLPRICQAQADAEAQNVKAAMEILKAKAAELGPAKIAGEDTVAGKKAPVLLFGETKMNNNFTLVDEIQEEVGGTATIFVKSDGQFVRVATNVRRDDGSRAIGTILDPEGKVIEAIRKGESFYGEADILGTGFMTGYEPIWDAREKIIGIYYVGYVKGK